MPKKKESPPATPRLVTVADVCSATSLSRPFVYKLIQDGKLSTIRIGRAVRVRYEDLERIIKEGIN